MEHQTVDLNAENFSPIPTFFKIFRLNPRIAVPILLMGCLPSFLILLCSLWLPGPSNNFWFLLNGSFSSFSSILIVYFVGRDLGVLLNRSRPPVSTGLISVLAVIALAVNLVLTFGPVLLPLPAIVEAVLPVLGAYWSFVVLNLAVVHIDSGEFPLANLGAGIAASHRRLGYGFTIGFSLVVLVLVVLTPVLLLGLFHVVLVFNTIYYYFFISLILPAFSSIFYLSYLKKEYFTAPKPTKPSRSSSTPPTPTAPG